MATTERKHNPMSYTRQELIDALTTRAVRNAIEGVVEDAVSNISIDAKDILDAIEENIELADDEGSQNQRIVEILQVSACSEWDFYNTLPLTAKQLVSYVRFVIEKDISVFELMKRLMRLIVIMEEN
jgi:hypothetical protein